MAVKPSHPPGHGHQKHRTEVNPTASQACEAQVASHELEQDSPTPQEDTDDVSSHSVPLLFELCQLLKAEKYQERRCYALQAQLHHAHVVAARTTRLLHTARSVQRTLAECIKAEDKHSFANLFNSFHDALANYSELPHAILDHEETEGEECVNYPTSFLDVLPSGLQSTVLDFINKVRQDGDFVANRLAALTHRELVSLLPGKGQSRSSDSVLGSSPRASIRTSKHLGFVADVQTDLLSTFEFGCPLDVLVHGPRGLSDLPLYKDNVSTDVWATVCARLISEQKSGSERFVPAVIEAFAASSPWPGKGRLGIWMSNTLQSGAFLLEQSNKPSFRTRSEGQEDVTNDDTGTEAFYGNAVHTLMELLADQTGASVIPEGALKFCQAICGKLPQGSNRQQAFPSFVLTRWLLNTFIPDAVGLPEIHGLMVDYFVSDNARQRILREVANRCQRDVFDAIYTWKLGNVASVDSLRLVRAIAERFNFVRPDVGEPSADVDQRLESIRDDSKVIPLCAVDVIALVNALCPRRRPASFNSEIDPSETGLRSSASSISGFSLFQSPPITDSPYLPSSGWSQEGMTTRSAHTDLDAAFDTQVVDDAQLRQACSSLEEYAATRSSSRPDSWCILAMDPFTHTVRAVREILVDSSISGTSAAGNETDAVADSMDYRICKDAIESLLGENGHTLQDDSGTGALLLQQVSEAHSYLQRLFEFRILKAEEDMDFIAVHAWFRKYRSYQVLVLDGKREHTLSSMLRNIEHARNQRTHCLLLVSESCDVSLRSMQGIFEVANRDLTACVEACRHLRDKMWYVADVRTSAAYDEARSIASALKVMGKLKKSSRTRPPAPSRLRSGIKAANTSLHLKTEAQILDLLSAAPEHGGPNKLSGDQSKALSTWMEHNAVENLCQGEERLQKLFMELRKAVEQLTADNSTSWTSALFARENFLESPQGRNTQSNLLWSLSGTPGNLDSLTLQMNVHPSIETISTTSSQPLSTRSSRDVLAPRSPSLTNKSSAPFWSPVVTEARSPSSATSVGSSQTHPAVGATTRAASAVHKTGRPSVKEAVRQHATSLLFSDLGLLVFAEGSETDRALWTGLGETLSEKHMRTVRTSLDMASSNESSANRFDFEKAFETLIRLFSASPNPFVKLGYLYDIDTLLAPYMAESTRNAQGMRPELQERSQSLRHVKTISSSPTTALKVEGFRRIFCNKVFRPSAVFRDLQCIAALVPWNTLETRPEGKAFWNATAAISGLKQDIRLLMVETADSIIAYHSNNRGHGRSSSIAQQERDSATFSAPSRTPSAEDISHYTMADAACLLQITAKEGDPVAQRELGTLYLTNPELMDHIIAPLSRPRDVFKEELESKWRKNQDPTRCDPITMCVAHHWMSMSSKGGDSLAKEYLRQREEMDMLG